MFLIDFLVVYYLEMVRINSLVYLVLYSLMGLNFGVCVSWGQGGLEYVWWVEWQSYGLSF